MKLGIDLGGTNLRIAQVEDGDIKRKTSITWASQESLDSTLLQLKEQIAQIITPSVQGIGIGVPSVVDIERGIVYNVANIPSWEEVHLREILENEFHVPVKLNNDSNCFALGEKLFGKGQEFQNVVVITLGTGVGAGVITDGVLYTGANTGAGEIGLLSYLEYDFEYYCSSNFFVKYHNTTGENAYEFALIKDEKALRIWNEYGTHMGNLIKTVLFAYDPQAIILGGGIASAFDFFENAMNKTISDFPYTQTIQRINILTSDNNDVALLGASAL